MVEALRVIARTLVLIKELRPTSNLLRMNVPHLGNLARLATMNLGGNAIIVADIKDQDQPAECIWIAPLQSAVTNISPLLYGEPPAPALLSNEGQPPLPWRVATVDDDRLPPPRLSAAA
eukprot:2939561-Pyramimonas_sp.AAC.1